jgi:hypothetical protein
MNGTFAAFDRVLVVLGRGPSEVWREGKGDGNAVADGSNRIATV